MHDNSDTDSKNTPTLDTEIGSTGLKVFSGVIEEEFLPALEGTQALEIYQEMSDNDPVVGAMLFAVEMLIRNTEIKIIPKDESPAALESAQFVTECLHDMEKTFSETTNDMMSFISMGFSIHEEVYKRRMGPHQTNPKLKSEFNDGKIGWQKLPTRDQKTISKWDIGQHGELLGLWQQAPNQPEQVYIPANRFLHFRVNSKKDNPESKSVLRNAYRPWFFKKHTEELEAIGLERDLAGTPKGQLPSEYMAESASPAQKRLYRQMKILASNSKAGRQANFILPSDRDAGGNLLFDLELLSSGNGKGKNFDTGAIIARHNSNIAQTILADFILLGQQAIGSFALGSSKTKLFAVAIGVWLKTIADVFNKSAIPRLFAVNNMDIASLPRLEFGDIEDPDLKPIADYFSQLINAGAIVPDEALEDHLREQAHAPARPDGLAKPGMVPVTPPKPEPTNDE